MKDKSGSNGSRRKAALMSLGVIGILCIAPSLAARPDDRWLLGETAKNLEIVASKSGRVADNEDLRSLRRRLEGARYVLWGKGDPNFFSLQCRGACLGGPEYKRTAALFKKAEGLLAAAEKKKGYTFLRVSAGEYLYDKRPDDMMIRSAVETVKKDIVLKKWFVDDHVFMIACKGYPKVGTSGMSRLNTAKAAALLNAQYMLKEVFDDSIDTVKGGFIEKYEIGDDYVIVYYRLEKRNLRRHLRMK